MTTTPEPTTPDQAAIEARADAYARNTISPAFADALLGIKPTTDPCPHVSWYAGSQGLARCAAPGCDALTPDRSLTRPGDPIGPCGCIEAPEPEWLTSFRSNAAKTADEIYDRFPGLGGLIGLRSELSDPFVGLAAAYLHPLHAQCDEAERLLATARTRIADLEFDLRRQEEIVQELRGRNAELTARVDELLVPLGDQEANERRRDPSPEMREVSAGEASEGDTFTVTGTVQRSDDPPGFYLSVDGYLFHTIADLSTGVAAGIRFTRPVTPLPDKPGAVGTATVRGIKGVRVARSTDRELPWTVLTHDLSDDDVYWIEDSEITDYVPLLDGQEIL